MQAELYFGTCYMSHQEEDPTQLLSDPQVQRPVENYCKVYDYVIGAM